MALFKKGIHLAALPHTVPLRERFRIARKAGFEGVGLVLDICDEFTSEMTPAQLRQVLTVLREENLEPVDLAWRKNWQSSLTSNDPSVRAQAQKLISRQLKIASEMEISAVLVLPGFVGMDASPVPVAEGYSPANEIVDYAEAFERSILAFQSLAAEAREAGVTLCIENTWSRFLLSPLEMRKYLDAIDSPQVGAYFDTGNTMPYSYAEQWVRILGTRIKRVHLKDFRYGCAGTEGFVGLLEGDVDFAAVIRQLYDIGYRGWLTAEEPPSRIIPEFTAYRCGEAMRRIVELL